MTMKKRSLVLPILLASAMALGSPGAMAATYEEAVDVEAATASPEVPLEVIDRGRLGSLELVALANDEAARAYVPGLVMDLHVVDGVNIATPEGMEQAAAILENTEDWDELDMTLVVTLGPTDETGRAWADEVPVGLYVLTQSEADETGEDYRPMVFTMPSMSPVEGDGWVYDLRVYPKPAPEECDCEVPVPVEPEPVEEAPVEEEEETAVPAPTPGVPTGELLAQNRDAMLLGLALALLVGAASALVRPGGRRVNATD